MHYPWQHDDWQRLAAEFARLPNAWLFTGPAGIGKSEFAHQVAQALLCEAPGAGHHACGQCQACHWFAAGNHPDYRLLAPAQDEEDDDGKEGKASKRKLPVIKIDGVRAVIEFAHLSSHRGGRRVVVVEPAESLNPAAANALLKVLEEPPADVVFFAGKRRAAAPAAHHQEPLPPVPADRAAACRGAGLAAAAGRGRRRGRACVSRWHAHIRTRRRAGHTTPRLCAGADAAGAWPACWRR